MRWMTSPMTPSPDRTKAASREQAAAALAKKYADRADVTAADISDVLDDIDELTAAGQLFAPDAYADHAFDFKNRSNVVKALCLYVAHTCNLNCSYCFAAQGKFHGEAGLMSFETGKRALDFLIENSGHPPQPRGRFLRRRTADEL